MRLKILTCLLFCLGIVSEAWPQEKHTFHELPVRDVIHFIESQSPYRFLFRDALIAGKTVSFSADDDTLLNKLASALEPKGIGLRADEHRAMVFLYSLGDEAQAQVLSGVVVDGSSGNPLPYATLIWSDNGTSGGTTTDRSGRFRISADALPDESGITISYLGYQSITLQPSDAEHGQYLHIRLIPSALPGTEVVVTGNMVHSPDTLWVHKAASPAQAFGGEHTMRALAYLPSVHIAGPGPVHVRGSTPDAFDVQLDGMTVYNHQHFFGMFDAFHNESLQSVGFYPGVTPAYMSGPPGATLAYRSRSGSGDRVSGTAGLSNTMVRGGLKGPLLSNRSGWMVSGRYSLLDAGIFNNSELLNWGLDAGRPSSAENRMNASPAVRNMNTEAVFYDIHASVLFPTGPESSLRFSAYSGGNRALLRAERLQPAEDDRPPAFRPVETHHSWGNHSASLRYLQRPLGSWFLSHTAGMSLFDSEYRKDDFRYQRAGVGSRPFFRPFGNRNRLLNIRASQTADRPVFDSGWLTIGHTVQQFRVEYEEENAFQPMFVRTTLGWQWDHFVHLKYRTGHFRFSGGFRTHYYSNGKWFRLSPRAEFGYSLSSNTEISAGYSRNYQFLHSLSLTNYVMADFWVMSGKQQPPSSQDQFTARFQLRPQHGHLLQIEGFYRFMHYMRLPKINARQLLSEPDLESNPWFSNNRMRARGIEFLYMFTSSSEHRVSASYTLSSVETRNERLNRGAWYPLEWDRRHQLSLNGEVLLFSGFRLQSSWTLASGNFNQLSLSDMNEPDRNGLYHRLDAGAAYTYQAGRTVITLSFYIFNVYDRKNTLYRAPQSAAVRRNGNFGLIATVEDFYDLGLIPSFDLRFRF